MDALDKEIARINKMHIPAGLRSNLVVRAKRIADCLKSASAPLLDGAWCSRCGFAITDHDDMEERLK